MRKVVSSMLKLLELHLYGLGYLMVALLYLQIVVAPAGILVLLSAVSFAFFSVEVAIYIVGASGLIGLGLGVVWAERVRRTHGILTFHAYLLSTPEIDGWRDRNGIVVKR